jgi:hypothetical protein
MPRGKGKRRTKVASGGGALTERILASLGDSPGTKTSDLAERLGSDQLVIRNELMSLEKRGTVRRTGQTRGTRWFLSNGSAPADDLPPEAGSDGDARGGPKARVLDQNRNLLGTVPDSDVADRLGVSVRTIAAYRKQHGIGGYSGPKRAGKAAPRARTRSSGSAQAAWRVDIRIGSESVVRYVFALSLVDAARTATSGASSLGGEVVGIGWVGEALA